MASELGDTKPDLNNSSHYYRFKRHSLGYQSQGPSSLKSPPLINAGSIGGAGGGREQSQTASGVNAFNNIRARGPPMAAGAIAAVEERKNGE